MFSFECVNNDNCYNMISDPAKQDAYINNGLKPFLAWIENKGFKDQVSALELFNEPEWMVEKGSSGVKRNVGLDKVQ